MEHNKHLIIYITDTKGELTLDTLGVNGPVQSEGTGLDSSLKRGKLNLTQSEKEATKRREDYLLFIALR